MKNLKLSLYSSLLILGSSFSYAQNYTLYGLNSEGGTGGGTLFGYNINTQTYTVQDLFNSTNGGTNPVSTLIRASNGLLYGTTKFGGTGGAGVLFSFDPSINLEIPLINFSGIIGDWPAGKPIQASNGKLYGMTEGGGTSTFGLIYSYNITSAKDSTVLQFSTAFSNYGDVVGNLVQDSTVGGGGLLYGVTANGGANKDGIIFSYNPVTGDDTILHVFTTAGYGGWLPYSSLMQASNGLLYGTTQDGGDSGVGILFSFNTHTKAFTRLLSFDSTIYPPFYGVMCEGKNGMLYWPSYGNSGYPYRGGICCYNINTNKDSLIYKFDSTHGEEPFGSLILDTANGLMYGMTWAGGAYDLGVLFSFDPSTGTEKDLVDLYGPLGYNPYGDLLLVEDTIPTTVNELKAKSEELKVFPNPFTNTTTILLTSYLPHTTCHYLELNDITGRKLKYLEFTGNEYTLSAEGLAKGMYFVRVFACPNGATGRDNENNVIGTTKIVVQ